MMLRSVLLAIALSSTAAFAAPSLSLEVSGPDAVQKVDDLLVKTTLKNTGDSPLDLLNTPASILSDFPTNTFEITNLAGAIPEFMGVAVKYATKEAIESGDITRLAPGESITTTHDLSKAYNFTTPGEGRYSMKASNIFHVVDRATKELSMIEATVDKVHEADISGKLVAVTERSLEKRANFRSCSADQQNAINQAIQAALRYSYDTTRYLQSTGDTPRYRTWFGAFTAARHNTVLDHFGRIYNSNFNTYTYDCGCDRANVYAYVYPDRFREMWLCPVFWRAPVTGTDSKGGTLVHEASHYTANGGTRDYAYGQANAQALARNNPDQAVFNADSHEYIAENNPPQA